MSQYAQVGKPFCPWTLFNSTALTHFPVQKFTQELCSLKCMLVLGSRTVSHVAIRSHGCGKGS